MRFEYQNRALQFRDVHNLNSWWHKCSKSRYYYDNNKLMKTVIKYVLDITIIRGSKPKLTLELSGLTCKEIK